MSLRRHQVCLVVGAMMAIGTSLASAADPVGADADGTPYLQDGTVVKYVLVAGHFDLTPAR